MGGGAWCVPTSPGRSRTCTDMWRQSMCLHQGSSVPYVANTAQVLTHSGTTNTGTIETQCNARNKTVSSRLILVSIFSSMAGGDEQTG